MAQLVVRNIDDQVKARLKRRAAHRGRSMEEEVRDILRNAANEGETSSDRLGTVITSLFRRVGLKAAIPELRGHKIRPAAFEE